MGSAKETALRCTALANSTPSIDGLKHRLIVPEEDDVWFGGRTGEGGEGGSMAGREVCGTRNLELGARQTEKREGEGRWRHRRRPRCRYMLRQICGDDTQDADRVSRNGT